MRHAVRWDCAYVTKATMWLLFCRKSLCDFWVFAAVWKRLPFVWDVNPCWCLIGSILFKETQRPHYRGLIVCTLQGRSTLEYTTLHRRCGIQLLNGATSYPRWTECFVFVLRKLQLKYCGCFEITKHKTKVKVMQSVVRILQLVQMLGPLQRTRTGRRTA